MFYLYHKIKKNDNFNIKNINNQNRINHKVKANQSESKRINCKCLKLTICRLLLSRLFPRQIRLMVLKEIIQVYNTLHRVSKLFITLDLYYILNKYMTIYELILKINLLEIQMKHLKEEILEKRMKDLEDRLNNVEKIIKI